IQYLECKLEDKKIIKGHTIVVTSHPDRRTSGIDPGSSQPHRYRDPFIHAPILLKDLLRYFEGYQSKTLSYGITLAIGMLLFSLLASLVSTYNRHQPAKCA
ncbi:hypothetical protein BGZ65_010116, partial [Modicella reniformis]